MKTFFMKKTAAVALAVAMAACSGNKAVKPAETESTEPTNTQTMNITKEAFGEYDGQAVERYTLTNNKGMTVKIITYGGAINEINVPDKNGNFGNVALGFDSLDGYRSPAFLRVNPYFGAIIGRYGNRIGDAKVTLNGQTYQLDVNDGKNHLHGGFKGFDKVVWKAEPIKGDNTVSLKLTYFSADGEGGFPGNMNVTVTYTLNDENQIVIDYEATSDKDTYCNLTNHCYFNLSANPANNIYEHQLTILADQFTEIDGTLIPTGKLIDVAGTPMDFTKPTAIGAHIEDDYPQIKLGNGYDHNWALRSTDGTLALAATAYEPTSGRVLEVYTVEPGLQFYAGNFLNGSFGRNGQMFGRRCAFCLETQHFPDSPNKPAFASSLLKAGETYKTQTIYQFSTK